MRRGLIARSPDELPDAALDARLARVRAAMTRAGFDALLIYTNNTRPAGVSWLTGFVPYWSEALLVVPRDGDAVLVVALTFRVKSWIQRTSRVADVIHTPRIGLEAGRRIAAQKADAAVGVVDLDALSSGIADDHAEGGPGLAVTDASALFATARAQADAAEIALATRAATIARHALTQIPRDGDQIGPMLARRRRGGAAPGRRRGNLSRGGARSRARPSLAAHRRRRCTRSAFCGARQRRLQGELGAAGAHRRLRAGGTRCGRRALLHCAPRLTGARDLETSTPWLVEGCRLAQPFRPARRFGHPTGVAASARNACIGARPHECRGHSRLHRRARSRRRGPAGRSDLRLMTYSRRRLR